MIKVAYFNNHIILKSYEDKASRFLFEILNSNTKAIFKNNNWYVKASEKSWLNEKLKPVKSIIILEDSYLEWKKNSHVIITSGVIKSRIKNFTCIDKFPHEEIEQETRFFFKGAKYVDKYNDGKWDGYVNLYNRKLGLFPSGFLHIVTKILTKNNIPYSINYTYDRTPAKQFDWEICDNLIPDKDQIEAVNACLEGKRGVIKAPTGFGKTALVAKRLTVGFGVPTLFVANKKSLLDDAAKEFLTGIKGLDKVACIKDGVFGDTKLPSDDIKDIDAPVIVATIQSLYARLKDKATRHHLLNWLRNICKLVMVDECQFASSKTWDYVLDECLAPYRIYLSATPRRTDNATIKLTGGSGPLLFETTAGVQIEKGRLCELEIYYTEYNHKLYNEKDRDLNYHEAYKSFIIENEQRNFEYVIKPTLSMIEEERYVLVLIQYIEHGHILKEMFIRNGIKPEDIMFIWGDTPDKLRQNAIKEFRKGDFKIMIGSTIFDAGVNIPVISGVVLAGAGNSDITLVQRIGRGARNCDYEDLLGYLPEFMRKTHGKKITKVYDVYDTNVKFFSKQAKNRYINAINEFGQERVFLRLDKKNYSKKTIKEDKEKINQFEAQLDMLNKFTKKQ